MSGRTKLKYSIWKIEPTTIRLFMPLVKKIRDVSQDRPYASECICPLATVNVHENENENDATDTIASFPFYRPQYAKNIIAGWTNAFFLR